MYVLRSIVYDVAMVGVGSTCKRFVNVVNSSKVADGKRKFVISM